jgi:hypothetical protein
MTRQDSEGLTPEERDKRDKRFDEQLNFTANVCPHCESVYIRHSHVRWFEWPIKSLIEPFRCGACQRRFWKRRR